MIRQASINLFQLRLAKRNTSKEILWNSARWVSYSTLNSRRVVSSLNNGMVYKNNGTLYGCSNNVGRFQMSALRRNAEQQYRQFS